MCTTLIEKPQCFICFEQISSYLEMSSLSCGHKMHFECAYKALCQQLNNDTEDNCPYCRMPYTAKKEGEYSYQEILDDIVGEYFEIYQHTFGEKQITTQYFKNRKDFYKFIVHNIATDLNCQIISDDEKQIFSILYKGMVIPIETFYYLN